MADDGSSEYSSASDDFEDESSGEKEVIAVIMKKRWRRFIKFLLLDSM